MSDGLDCVILDMAIYTLLGNEIHTVLRCVRVGEDRVFRVRFVRPLEVPGTCHGNHMGDPGAACGCQKPPLEQYV